jgi:hypothetical protein
MAKANLIPGINRQKLLATAAVGTLTGVAPALPVIDAEVTPSAAQGVLAAPDVPALNLSATMAKRVKDIAQRNAVRAGAGLPLIPLVPELRRMKKVELEAAFARFEAAHDNAVLEAIIKRRREEIGDPSWTPRWAESVAIGNRVRGILLQRFGRRGDQSQRSAKINRINQFHFTTPQAMRAPPPPKGAGWSE